MYAKIIEHHCLLPQLCTHLFTLSKSCRLFLRSLPGIRSRGSFVQNVSSEWGIHRKPSRIWHRPRGCAMTTALPSWSSVCFTTASENTTSHSSELTADSRKLSRFSSREHHPLDSLESERAPHSPFTFSVCVCAATSASVWSWTRMTRSVSATTSRWKSSASSWIRQKSWFTWRGQCYCGTIYKICAWKIIFEIERQHSF